MKKLRGGFMQELIFIVIFLVLPFLMIFLKFKKKDSLTNVSESPQAKRVRYISYIILAVIIISAVYLTHGAL